MSNKTLRVFMRLLHLAVAALMVALIYTDLRLNGALVTVVQAVAVPLTALSGFVMWQQPRVAKLFSRSRAQEPRR